MSKYRSLAAHSRSRGYTTQMVADMLTTRFHRTFIAEGGKVFLKVLMFRVVVL